MKKYIAIIFSLLLCAAVHATSLKLSLDRNKIYLGESIIVNVTMEGSREGKNVPVFEKLNPAEVEFLGSRDNSQSSITIINGKVSRTSFEGRVFVFRITPSVAGTLNTGRIVLRTSSGTIVAPGATISVTGVEKREDITASIECEDATVMVDSPFTINLTVSLQALPAPYADIEPILQGKPLHIDAGYLNGGEIKGLKLPDLNSILNGLISRRSGREPAFTINQFASRGMSMDFFDFGSDPFASRPIQFRLPPKKVKRNGKDFWDYSISLDYTATAEGDYTFGPVTIKGGIIKGADQDRNAIMDEVFVVGPAVTVRVVPPPEEGRPEYFIGSVGKSMRATATLDTSRCKVGDPLTLTLDLTGQMSLSNLKPPLLSLQPGYSEDFRIYDDNIESDNIEGGKRFKYRVRPLRSGTLEFPAVYVAYYDTVKNSYVTIATDPMPLQVEETTRIAAASNDGGGNEGETEEMSAKVKVPDGIMSGAKDAVPRSFSFGPAKLIVSVVCAPLFWLLTVIIKALAGWLRRRHERGGLNRRAASNMREFHKASSLAATDPTAAAAAASGAARVAIAAKLGLETVSMTVPEMRNELASRGVANETIDDICNAFADLEQLSYSRGTAESETVKNIISKLGEAIEKVGAVIKTLLIAALLLGASMPREAQALGRAPDQFAWECANQAMATASSAEDFENVARMYYSMVTDGASSGPLFYNLGTALLLADKKAAAQEALIAAERHLGTSDEVADNMKLAFISETNPGQIPVSRVFMCWHYGIPFATRLDLAVAGWLILWIALTITVLLGKSKWTRHLRALFMAVAIIALFVFVVYGASSAVTYIQEKHVDLPHVAGSLTIQTPPQGE